MAAGSRTGSTASYELPWFGKIAFENSLANPATGDRTVVVSQDDQGGMLGQVYIYAGDKKSSGATPVEQAGLTGGNLYGIKVTGYPAEIGATGIPSGTRLLLVRGRVVNRRRAARDRQQHQRRDAVPPS